VTGARQKARLELRGQGSALHAVIRPPRDRFVILVAALLCVFSLVALVFGGKGLVARWPDWFLLGLLGFFALAFLAGAFIILWLCFGREEILADEEKLTVRTEMLFIKRSAEYGFDEITALEVLPEPSRPAEGLREVGNGPIVITHRGRIVRIGAGLSRAEALSITKSLPWKTCGQPPENRP